jgi:hypothetical protein
MQEVPRMIRGAIAPPLTCPFALSTDAADDGAGARSKKTASRRPFELMAMSWEVELRGFEPRTPCMPYEPSR